MRGVYLCSRLHRIPGCDIDYNDIVDYPGIDLCCDALDVDLSKYDFIIATPPCNYYSKANYRRDISDVAQSTKHLLPLILDKCIKAGKPFIVENVLNKNLLPRLADVYWFQFNYHIFYTNELLLAFNYLPLERQNKENKTRSKRDGNKCVDMVIKDFLWTIGALSD